MFVTLMLVTACVSPNSGELPFFYFASGVEATIAIGTPDGDEIILSAFGNVITNGLMVEGGKVRFRVPDVRARTILDLRNRRRPNALVAQIAAYPRDRRMWGDEQIDVYTLGVPSWFPQWATAVGIEITECPSVVTLRRRVSNNATHRLIVLGRNSDLDHPQDGLALGVDCLANVVVLDATWYEKRIQEPVVLQIGEIPIPLQKLGRWSWRDLPKFSYCWRPRLVWMNRATVARDEQLTLMELYLQPEEPNILLASYIPWVQKIGRGDGADAIFSALLRETARATLTEPFSRELMIYSGVEQWPDLRRPVLTCAKRVGDGNAPADAVQVVDLRGEITARQINRLSGSTEGWPLLILGDDPILRSIRKLPKPGTKLAPSARIIWLSADELPASATDQETLMRVLTKYQVPLISDLENDR